MYLNPSSLRIFEARSGSSSTLFLRPLEVTSLQIWLFLKKTNLNLLMWFILTPFRPFSTIFWLFFHGYVLVAWPAWHVRIRNESFFPWNDGVTQSRAICFWHCGCGFESGTAHSTVEQQRFLRVSIISHSGYRPGTVGWKKLKLTLYFGSIGSAFTSA